jgi:hypothetical protein
MGIGCHHHHRHHHPGKQWQGSIGIGIKIGKQKK